jgi:2-oxoglutarate dehydrogenase E2 component (dihydrolipoamide succinyltransferase)
MAIELKIPSVGESIKEVIIGTWMKKVGDTVNEDEPIVEVDSDKASQELGAPAAGVLSKILKEEGETVPVGTVIALIDENGKPAKAKTGARSSSQSERTAADAPRQRGSDGEPVQDKQAGGGRQEAGVKAEKPAAPKAAKSESRIMPAALRLMEESKAPAPAVAF